MSNLKINMNNIEEVAESLNSKSLRICVIGIGRIGLPTALSFAKSGLQTIGVDINENLVEKIIIDSSGMRLLIRFLKGILENFGAGFAGPGISDLIPKTRFFRWDFGRTEFWADGLRRTENKRTGGGCSPQQKSSPQ